MRASQRFDLELDPTASMHVVFFICYMTQFGLILQHVALAVTFKHFSPEVLVGFILVLH